MSAKPSRGVYRCGNCGTKGHTRDSCPTAKPIKRSPAWISANAGYRSNRANRLCSDCGRRSARARCKRCAARRKLWPSRQAAYRKTHERSKR